MAWLCFGDLRTHLLDTHNAEAVKYIAFLLFTMPRRPYTYSSWRPTPSPLGCLHASFGGKADR